ncbi:hypothetical protein KOW79_006404 [Hemibagrus wyckioides]|uniref:Uncharacterized protein n=1 Tax=Hemibagrus wyckioides TaxID=337641 RepID=A0A9D3P093_9TELE|nr:hypothetical protein KOW79_006404 [Hemibagrus wyckioides]
MGVFFSREYSAVLLFFHYQSPPIDTAVQYDSSPIAPNRNLCERGDIKRLKGRAARPSFRLVPLKDRREKGGKRKRVKPPRQRESPDYNLS